MRIKVPKKDAILHFFLDNYYIFVILLYFCTLMKKNFPVGICSSLIMLITAVLLIVTGKRRPKMTMFDVMVLLYGGYCLVSAVWVVINGISLEVYVRSVTNSLLPMIFYFCAKEDGEKFYKRFLYANHVCCLLGLILLMTMPTWYFLYCTGYGYSFTRLSSCIGSTAIGSLSAIAVVISIRIIYETKGKKGKIHYILSLVFAFASMQRSAWIVVALTLILMHYFIFIKWRTVKLRFLCVEIFGVLAAGILARNQIVAMVERWVLEHQVAGGDADTGLLGSIIEMFAGRGGQWVEALKSTNLLFGSGYGTVGHKAVGYVENIVADGSWVCLLCEIGIIGMVLFLMIIVVALVNAANSFDRLFLPMGILLCIILQATGSNMFEYQIIMPLFWYAIGEISCKRKRRSRKNEYESIRNLSSSVS